MTPEQVKALQQIQRLWPGRSCCLIGAAALGCQMDCYWRQTYDLDITVAVSVNELQLEMRDLAGWSQDQKLEHRWTGPGDLRVDILPAGPEIIRKGHLVWPISQQVMDLKGFRLVFEHAEPMTLEPDLTFYVAPLRVITLLKTISYLDRPYDRQRDLQDISHILEEYLAPEDPRRFEKIILEAQVPFYHTSAFTLGRDLSSMVNDQELSSINDFIARARNPNDRATTQSRMLAMGPMAWQNNPEELLGRLDALELGLSSS